MSDHKPLPVQGYRPQANEAIDKVNQIKADIERLKRELEYLRDMSVQDEVSRCFSLSITKLEEAEFWAVKGVFNPDRIELPEDKGAA